MNRTWLRRIAGLALVAVLSPDVVFAQDAATRGGADLMEAMTANVARQLAAPREQSTWARARSTAAVPLAFQPPSQQPGVQIQSKHERKVAYGILLGLAGMWGGASLGAVLEPNCRCDDPGLTGALIGMPIGAVAGAIFGVWLGGR
jgi:hypothetical protein